MAARRIIADSDDEDSGDEPLCPLERELEPPQPEPLSPQHRPSSPNLPNGRNHISDTTDPSFFAEVYSEQQNRALQQSHLVEKIVRQSQKASASSGEVITPKRSAGGEWDVPSSPIDLVSGVTACPRGDGDIERTQGKQLENKNQSTEARQADSGSALGSSHPSATKKRKISLYDAAGSENSNFYIAQSNLTTMQKLEYQKVNVSQNGYSALPGSLSNQKSSCATTIAYPTPSRYASSGPPLPWERPASPSQEDGSHETTNMTSSPDVIALEHTRSPRRASDTSQIEGSFDRLVKSPSMRPSTDRNKERPEISGDADELGQEEPWNSDANDEYQDNYKPRPSRRRTKATTIMEDDDLGEDPISTINGGSLEKPVDTDVEVEVEVIPDAPNTSTVDEASTLDQPEQKPTVQPKKRGRKKKQPVTEEINHVPGDESPAINQEPDFLGPAIQPVASTEKPKKKRGRPRKSDTAAKVEAVAAERDVPAETSVNPESEVTDARPEQSASDQDDQDAEKRKTKKMKVDDRTADGGTVPLKDVDRNTRSPSNALSSDEPLTKTPAETPAPENRPSKPEAKKSSSSTPQPPKVPYRVGLSKRSRIAPLLKIIRK
ncbi:hypothetical protein F4809DRAFT_612862 [Biscogniauxia mediterranea]|nr:hypothetical protein F4809DRAFT_612862 [Biscogniauxia mediterranea]